MRRTLRVAVLCSVFAVTASVISATLPATAETNPYSPERVCGSGFHQIDRQGINGGVVYLLYNRSSRQNCVTTIKTVSVGTATLTSARLEVKGDSTVYQDSGRYKYFAGPVKRNAAHKCVRWGGSSFLASFLSRFGHCS